MALNLEGKISLDGSGFERGLHRAGEKASEFSTDLIKNAAIAAFGLYGVEEAIHKTVETATELVNESKRLDLTVEQLQLLRQAAEDGGTEIGTLASAFEKLDIARSKALSGDKEALQAFGRLGVSNSQLKSQTAATIFTTSISSAAKGGNVENLAPAFKEVLGKGFGELIPVLKTDFDELRKRLEGLGVLIDTDTAVKLKEIGDEFGLLKNILAVRLGPAIIDVVEALQTFLAKLNSTGIGLEELLNGGKDKGAKGFFQGAMSLQKFIEDSVINLVPGKLGDKLQDLNDKRYAFFGLSPKDALNNVLRAGSAFGQDDDEQTAKLEAMRKALAAAANDLKNPKPIIPPLDTARQHKTAERAQDSLVKVGNFLGGNGNTISRADQQKIDLLRRTAVANEKLLDHFARTTTSSLFSGIGVPQ